MVMLRYGEYRRKVKGCYTGKTLHSPSAGCFDEQSARLESLCRWGLPVNRRVIAETVACDRGCPEQEKGRLERWGKSLFPPFSGQYNNPYFQDIAAVRRVELWACLAPADPSLAVKLTREDACVDHGGDGIDAALFLAAVESAAFVQAGCQELIETGLAFLTPAGRIQAMLKAVWAWWKELGNPVSVKERLLSDFFSDNQTDAGINISLIVLAWLSSEGNTQHALQAAETLGYDVAGNAATVGALMGILQPNDVNRAEESVEKVCDRIAAASMDVLRYYGSNTTFIHEPQLCAVGACVPPWAPADRFLSLGAGYSGRESLVSTLPLTIRLLYPASDVMTSDGAQPFTAFISNPFFKPTVAVMRLKVTDGWVVSPDRFDLEIRSRREQQILFTVLPVSPMHSLRGQLEFCIDMDGQAFSFQAGLID